MSATRTASASSASIPRYRNPALTSRLPPPKLPLFRSVVAHPPAPWATQQQQSESATNETLKKDAKGKGKGKGKADKVRERSLADFGELGSGSSAPRVARPCGVPAGLLPIGGDDRTARRPEDFVGRDRFHRPGSFRQSRHKQPGQYGPCIAHIMRFSSTLHSGRTRFGLLGTYPFAADAPDPTAVDSQRSLGQC